LGSIIITEQHFLWLWPKKSIKKTFWYYVQLRILTGPFIFPLRVHILSIQISGVSSNTFCFRSYIQIFKQILCAPQPHLLDASFGTILIFSLLIVLNLSRSGLRAKNIRFVWLDHTHTHTHSHSLTQESGIETREWRESLRQSYKVSLLLNLFKILWWLRRSQ